MATLYMKFVLTDSVDLPPSGTADVFVGRKLRDLCGI